MLRTLTGALSLLLVTALLLVCGCNRPSNATSNKGPGGLPVQQVDNTGDVIPWEVPPDLVYANWTQMFPDNNRIYLVSDSVETVAKWYKEKMPDAVQEDINGKRHIVVRDKLIEVDIESGGDKTKIAFTPLDIQLAK